MNDPFFIPQKKKKPQANKRGFRASKTRATNDDDDDSDRISYSAKKAPRLEENTYSARTYDDDNDDENNSDSENEQTNEGIKCYMINLLLLLLLYINYFTLLINVY